MPSVARLFPFAAFQRYRALLWPLAAALLLNSLLSFTSWWPTIAVQPDSRIAPEFTLLLVGLSAYVASGRRVTQRWLNIIAGFYLVLIVGRYVDVVAPALFGRSISLYWDIPQLPRFIWVTVTRSPVWLTVAVLMGMCAGIWAFHRLLRGCWAVLLNALAPVTRQARLWAVYAPLSLLIGANYAGVQSTWPYVSKPVIPTYARELGIVMDVLIPGRAERLLPASDTVNAALADSGRLAGLNQRDVMLMFLESHGAVLYDKPDIAAQTKSSLDAWQDSINRSGRHAVSAFFTAPTIGGASDLSHLSLLSGIDLSDPRRYDLLVTTKRPTLLSVFQQSGYKVFAMYHSVYWDWVERSYYGFDTYLSGPDLGYTGPEFGFWKVPDQFAMAKLEALHPRTAQEPPRITVMSTMSTHFPFVPTPPYQPDWTRLLGPDPFDADAVKASLAQQVNWTKMAPDYVRTVNYAYTWLAGWFAQPEQRETVYLLVGDHQPTSNITGEGVRWDVPVYVISRDQALLDRFRKAGFTDGLVPQTRESRGGLHELTSIVVRAFRYD